jgi:CubicO group peptidase (beta-lactamase class C family)
VRYLPEFRVADEDATRQVTARHLLTHSSGIAGDFFPDTGRGEDCLEKYVALMSELPADSPLGATMSYCNAGFTLLGRLVEVLRGLTWDAVMRERLLQPLGLEAAGTLPEEALLWGTATGHLTPPGSTEPVVAPQWAPTRNAGPAGLLHGRARDLLAFSRMHLADGLAADGTRLLSAESAQAMRQPQVDVPDRWTLGGHVGLAWILMEWNGRRVLGHDGDTIGQSAYLRIVPGDGRRPDLVVSLLTNGGDMRDRYSQLEPPAQPPVYDASQYAGRYVRESMEVEVVRRGDESALIYRPSGILATAMGAAEIEAPLLPFDREVFLTTVPGVAGYMPAVFYRLPDGTPHLHLGGRAARRA